MTDRTSNVTYNNTTDPQLLYGVISASDNDYFDVSLGKPLRCVVTSVDDDDAIVSASISGRRATIRVKDDAGAAVTVDFNINFIIVLSSQAI